MVDGSTNLKFNGLHFPHARTTGCVACPDPTRWPQFTSALAVTAAVPLLSQGLDTSAQCALTMIFVQNVILSLTNLHETLAMNYTTPPCE